MTFHATERRARMRPMDRRAAASGAKRPSPASPARTLARDERQVHGSGSFRACFALAKQESQHVPPGRVKLVRSERELHTGLAPASLERSSQPVRAPRAGRLLRFARGGSARRPVVCVLLLLEAAEAAPRGYGRDARRAAPTTARGGGVSTRAPTGAAVPACGAPAAAGGTRSSRSPTSCAASSPSDLERELAAHADLLRGLAWGEAASAPRGACGATRRADPRAHRRLPADACVARPASA